MSLRPSAPLALVTLALLSVAGCKPGAQDLCERYAVSTCRFHYQCCNASERSRIGGIGGQSQHSTEAECVEVLTHAICTALAGYSDAEQNGRIQWDGAKQNECLQPFEEAASTCDAETFLAFQVGGENCEFSDIATGLVEDGDTCFITDECADDEARCAPDQPDDPDEQLISAKGTCTPPPGTGDECPDFICRDGLYCDAAQDPRVCAPLLGDGDACTNGFECLSQVCSVDVCAPKLPIDDPCTSPVECQSEFCDYFDTFTCQQKQANGERCNLDAECAGGNCNLGTAECGADENNVTYDICLADEQ